MAGPTAGRAEGGGSGCWGRLGTAYAIAGWPRPFVIRIGLRERRTTITTTGDCRWPTLAANRGITRPQRLSATPARPACPSRASGWPAPPVLRTLSLCACRRHYSGAADEWYRVAQNHPSVSAFPGPTAVSACTLSFSRLAQRSLTLRPTHSRGHLDVAAIRRLQTLRHLHACSGCFRLERVPGGACTRWRIAAFSTAHVENGLPAATECRCNGSRAVLRQLLPCRRRRLGTLQ